MEALPLQQNLSLLRRRLEGLQQEINLKKARLELLGPEWPAWEVNQQQALLERDLLQAAVLGTLLWLAQEESIRRQNQFQSVFMGFLVSTAPESAQTAPKADA